VISLRWVLAYWTGWWARWYPYRLHLPGQGTALCWYIIPSWILRDNRGRRVTWSMIWTALGPLRRIRACCRAGWWARGYSYSWWLWPIRRTALCWRIIPSCALQNVWRRRVATGNYDWTVLSPSRRILTYLTGWWRWYITRWGWWALGNVRRRTLRLLCLLVLLYLTLRADGSCFRLWLCQCNPNFLVTCADDSSTTTQRINGHLNRSRLTRFWWFSNGFSNDFWCWCYLCNILVHMCLMEMLDINLLF